MKEISPEELYSLYKDTLYRCQSKIFQYADDIIETMVFENFVIGATSFLHDDSLKTLFNNHLIDKKQYDLSRKIRALFFEIEDCGELTINCLKGQSEKWKHLTSLVDEAVAGVKNEVVLLECELEYIHDRIEELSSVDLQNKRWLNRNNDTEFISSYAELMCSLYEDLNFELVLRKAMERYGYSNNALNELCKLNSLLNNYEEPYTNGYIDDELIIKDSNWQVIVKQAQTVLANWDQIQPLLSQL
ncbi:MAG: hypothetical protein K5890_02410 [Bacteroidales bacterium]|nr:hypothetical protein [Bacteroidales bacterium]